MLVFAYTFVGVTERAQSPTTPPHVRFAESLYLNVTLSDVRLFACNRRSVCLMTVVNRASLSVINDSTAVILKGCQLHYMKQLPEVGRQSNGKLSKSTAGQKYA